MEGYRQSGDRARFLVAWALARSVAGAMVGLPPDEVPVDRTCRRCGAGHGKPRVVAAGASIELSLSHTAGRVVVALSMERPVGVDMEADTLLGDEVSPVLLTPHERHALEQAGGISSMALLRAWVRKEAVVKATGDGLLMPLNSFAVSPPTTPARLVEWPPDPTLPGRLTLRDLSCGQGYVAALAMIGDLGDIWEHDGSAHLALLR
jgi:4'-phosphopantetheinyl transferase